MRIHRALLIHRLASPSAAARTATLAEVGQDLAPEQLDPLVHLGDGVGHEQHAGQRSHPGLLVGADALADRVGTADEVTLLVAAGLFAERRGPERLQVPGELRGAEALERLLVRPADGDGELWGDVDLRAVATGPLRGTVDVLHALGDLLGGEHGRQPPLSQLAGAAPDLGVVAAGVDRERPLDWLGKALDLLEVRSEERRVGKEWGCRGAGGGSRRSEEVADVCSG